ncbi:hypothetical protein E3N88_17474 [Mikania micrantha]|uniref:Uncharacterized protein n=1 Tax=Mikania micrantha TaxID=192012 RepID=A0A5N6NUQ7_9ASTR|nr:hypothetical protein E3N88_17474 [Mikania micrantha]
MHCHPSATAHSVPFASVTENEGDSDQLKARAFHRLEGPHAEAISCSPEKKTGRGSPEKKAGILLASDGETDTTDGILATRGERWCRDWWMAPPWFAGNEPARRWWLFLSLDLSPPPLSLLYLKMLRILVVTEDLATREPGTKSFLFFSTDT